MKLSLELIQMETRPLVQILEGLLEFDDKLMRRTLEAGLMFLKEMSKE